MTSQSGDDIEFRCEVSGDPEPEVSWHREDGQISEDRAVIKRGRLSIARATPQDEGIYICEANNAVGRISINVALSVHGKCVACGNKSKLRNV